MIQRLTRSGTRRALEEGKFRFEVGCEESSGAASAKKSPVTIAVIAVIAVPLIALLVFLLSALSGGRVPLVSEDRPMEPGTIAASARKCLLNFINADSIDEKLRYVRQKPGIRRRIARQEENETGLELAEFLPGVQFTERGGKRFLFLPIRTADFRIRDVAFELTESGPRLDWDYYAGFSRIEWEEFLIESPSGDGTRGFQLLVESSDYFNWDYGSPEEYACYRLSHPHEDVYCYGYAKVGSTVCEELNRMLRKNAELGFPNAKAILSLKGGTSSRSPKQVLIHRVESEDWLVP